MLWEVWATMWGGSFGDILYCWPRTLSRPNRWCDSIGTGSNYGKRNQVHPSDQSIALVDQDGHIWRLQFHFINCHKASLNIVIIIIVLSHTTCTFLVLFLIKFFLTIFKLITIWTIESSLDCRLELRLYYGTKCNAHQLWRHFYLTFID